MLFATCFLHSFELDPSDKIRRSSCPPNLRQFTSGRPPDRRRLLLAGHETTATALSWTWYLLSHNPEEERKLHAEVDQVLGGRAASVADLPNLTYTGMVIDEAMRLHPPVWAIGRAAIAYDEIMGYRCRPDGMWC
jgi:Cytochrome P450